MGKYLSTFDTLADYQAATSELGYPNVSLIKADGSILYVKNAPTPTGSTCYEIIPETIGSYTATTYDSVYSATDAKWYMLNNLNEYEQYGVYDIVEDISTATTYEGKLAIVDGYEYKYANDQWNNIGEAIMEYVPMTTGFSSSQVLETIRLDISGTTSSVKIYLSNVPDSTESNSSWYINMIGTKSQIYYTTDGTDRTSIRVTACTLVSGTTYEFTFPYPMYFNAAYNYSSRDISGMPLVASAITESVPEKYAIKEAPIAKVYSTVADMEAVGCPTVGISQYGVVGDNVYQFEESEEWVNKAKSSLKFVAKYNDGNANVIACITSNELSSGETKPSYLSNNAITEAYIGDCVTSIGSKAFDFCSGLTSVNIGSGVTSISDNAFSYCRSLTSIKIPDSVTTIGGSAFVSCANLTSVTIGNGVTSIRDTAFAFCTKLTSVTVNATTPPTLGFSVFDNTSNCPIYVPSESVNAYKTAINWKDYASRIQAIP